jgi:hypothetical protein
MKLNMVYEAVEAIEEGRPIFVETNMGSCQCGDALVKVFLKDGVLWAKSCPGFENPKWKKYDGPAEQCTTSYGVGIIVRQIAEAWSGHRPGEKNLKMIKSPQGAVACI